MLSLRGLLCVISVVKCEVWTVKREVWSVKCEVCSLECEDCQDLSSVKGEVELEM